MSRIDRIYITETEGGKVQNTNFYKTPWDDHKIYKMNISDNIDIGPGQWALNINLLKDPTFMKTLEKEWIEFRKIKNEFGSIKGWWDAVKCYIRTIAISYAQQKARIKRDFITNVENQTEVLESNDRLTEGGAKIFKPFKRDFANYEKEKSEGYRIRSRIPHFEIEEPNINYYSKMAKINTEKNLLHALYDQNENSVFKRRTKNVLKITSDFYKNLYEEQNTDEICQRELLSSVNESISSTDKAFFDDPISLHELEIALKELPLHKSPGLDGLPAEFYRSMWETIKLDFHELITEISKDKELTFSQKRGAIRIVFKKQNRHIYI